MLDRMIRAARLDTSLYEEVESNTSLTSQAATVVVIAAVCQGIGTAIAATRNPEAGNPILGLVGGLIAAIVGWVIWSYVTYWIGTSMFGGMATPGEMLRTIGFAQSPQVLNILSFIPVVGVIISLVVGIWVLVAGVVAVRQALDFTTGKALGTAVIGWLVLMVLTCLVGTLVGGVGLLTGAVTGR